MIFNQKPPVIDSSSKVIVGIGDSFTQGVGGWSKETYDRCNGFIDPLNIPPNLTREMYDNSWVKQLYRNHMPDYLPINLGVMGTGNRAAVKELYLNPDLQLHKAKEVIVIWLLSGMERFDFVNKEFPSKHHFYTMWPNYWDKNTTDKKLWAAYAKSVYSDKFAVVEALMNIREAEMICKANGWKFVVASAFEQRYTKEFFLNTLKEHNQNLIDTVPWDRFIYPNGMKSFMELLLDLDGNRHMADGEFYEHYSKLKYPTNYITNCMHPTVEGYRIIAEKIYDFISSTKG
jgi:hypothetical protein